MGVNPLTLSSHKTDLCTLTLNKLKMITIKFDTVNAAFNDCEGIESARIIADLCKHLEFHSMQLSNDTYIIKDLNGNKIGSMETSSEQIWEDI